MIIIYYDPFDMESRIYRMNGETVANSYVRSDVQTVAESLMIDCRDFNITDVKIHAPKHIFEEIAGIIHSNYGATNIVLENV